MKRRTVSITAVVLLLAAMIPMLAMAQGAGQGERTGSIVLRMGDHPLPAAGDIAKSGQAESVKEAAGSRDILPKTDEEKLGIDPRTPAGTILKIKEGFESAWPNGAWYTFDNNGSTGGTLCWDDENWIAKKGSWSGWPAGGCAGGLNPNNSYYPNNMDSWMVYGPFSTSGAKNGNLKFNYWNQSEEGYDYLYWCVSPNYADWYCDWHTGSTANKWKVGKINLKSVPGYGSMLGDSSVYLAFVFQSDSSEVDDGPFIDEVSLVVKN